MKRRITVEQLNELTEEQKQKLREWWKPCEGDIFIDKDLNKDIMNLDSDEFLVCADKTDFPLFDIGQMIWIIGKEKTGRTIMREWRHNELCDALWEAVKQVL